MKKTTTLTLMLTGLFMAATLSWAEEDHEHHDHAQHKDKDHAAVDTTESHADEDLEDHTITGEIIDITCYIRHDSKGEGHTKCAITCANMGMPLGVLEDKTNKIYLIIPDGHGAPKEPVMEYFGKKVEVDASFWKMGGLVSLEVQGIREVKP